MVALVEIKVRTVSGEALGIHAVQMGWIEFSHHRNSKIKGQRSK